MPIKIQSTRDLALQHGVKILLYGEAGSGKTTLAKSITKPLIISAEKGLLSIADAEIDCIEVATMADFNEAYQFCLSPAADQYHCIYIDSISEIGETILASEKGMAADVRQAYGALIDQMTALVKAFRDLSHKHVVLVAKAETYAPDGAAPVVRPGMPGSKLANELPYLVDEVLRIVVAYDGTRTIQTQPDGLAIAKDRSGKLNPKGEDANDGLQAIIDKILT